MATMSETPTTNAQLRIIARKALLGDEEAQRLSEERGPVTTQRVAKNAAGRMGLCSCSRSDGIICGTRLFSEPARKLGVCYRCWASAKDDRDCDHAWYQAKGE